MKLYMNPVSPNSRKVTLTMEELGLEMDMVVMDLRAGEHRTPEFLAKNPNGKIPLLEDGDTMMWESNAIIAYLASKQDTSLWPKSQARYDIIRWLSWESCHWTPAINTYISEHIFKQDPADPAVLEKADKNLKRFTAALNAQLENNNYLVGNDFTLADIAVASPLMYIEQAQIPIANYPIIQRWFERVSNRPSWKATQ